MIFVVPLLCYVARSVHTKGSYSLPQKTLLLHCLKRLVQSQAFTSLSYVHYYVTAIM